jgi:hypothetical protein
MGVHIFFRPGKNIRIQTEYNRLLDWTVEFANHAESLGLTVPDPVYYFVSAWTRDRRSAILTASAQVLSG